MSQSRRRLRRLAVDVERAAERLDSVVEADDSRPRAASRPVDAVVRAGAAKTP